MHAYLSTYLPTDAPTYGPTERPTYIIYIYRHTHRAYIDLMVVATRTKLHLFATEARSRSNTLMTGLIPELRTEKAVLYDGHKQCLNPE